MALYKFVNEDYIQKATNPIKVDGICYSNPSEEVLLQLGYKPLEEVEAPEDKEGYYLSNKYIEENDKIIMNWVYNILEEGE
jgi:hypothetical protein